MHFNLLKKMYVTSFNNNLPHIQCHLHHPWNSQAEQDIKSSGMDIVFVCWGCHNKDHRLGGWNNRSVFPHSFTGYRFKIKVSAGLISSEASPLGLYRRLLSPSLFIHMVFPLCLCPNLFSYTMTQVIMDEGPSIWPHFILITTLKALSPNTVTFWNTEG